MGRSQSAHFILHAPEQADVRRLLDELEDAYSYLREYGLVLPSKISAWCYASTPAFIDGSGGGSYNLAIAIGEQIHLQPLRLLLKRGDLSRVLRHELTHVALNNAARRGLPRWMNEGMAMTVAAEKHPEHLHFREIPRLEDSLRLSRSHGTLRSAYGASERLVATLLAHYGKVKVLRLLSEVALAGLFDLRFVRLTGYLPPAWGRAVLGK